MESLTASAFSTFLYYYCYFGVGWGGGEWERISEEEQRAKLSNALFLNSYSAHPDV